MTTVPPLPDPGVQSPTDRMAISRRFIQHAREELASGRRLQAGEKAWGAVAQHLKLFAEQRGWRHRRHQQVQQAGYQIMAEFPDYRPADLSAAFANAYFKGHENFYENQYDVDDIEEAITSVEEALPLLEAIHSEAPRPFTITSNTERKRLAELTGDSTLRVGDTSPVGFSLRHMPSPRNDDGQG